MSTVKFATEPFTCPSCIKKIESAVGRLPGVEDVSVMFNSSKVKVRYDGNTVTPDAIGKTIEGLGYPVRSQSTPTAA